MKTVSIDVLVIGSGIAGLSFALKSAEHGRVALITKKQRATSNTNYAQGGIAAVTDPNDSIALHARDTIIAGAGLCHTRTVLDVVREGPARVRELIEWGVGFTRDHGDLSLGREGGHSNRRILHASDFTGREIERALLAAIGAHDRIDMFEDHVAVDLSVTVDGSTGKRRCTGVVVFDHRSGEVIRFESRFVLLATGGLAHAYKHTTNPDIATGDGVAMAYRAGAEVANLEFVQFHPTALYPADERAFLISEAVRGEGAVLRLRSGQALMDGVHPMGSLAPRDIVARAIDLALKETGDPYVLLDLSSIPRARIEARFPGILAECASRGIDIREEAIPVVPAAHYACGGVRTDARGRTSLAGLFAVGEVASTGMHGANRLASNSLLEAVVYSHRAAGEVPRELAHAVEAERTQALRSIDATSSLGASGHASGAPAGVSGPGQRAGPPFEIAANQHAPRSGARRRRAQRSDARAVPEWGEEEATCTRRELRRVMWEDAGIVRTTARLEHAAAFLDDLAPRIEAEHARGLDVACIELRNLTEVSRLVVRSALLRHESRGLHYTLDHPYRDNERHLKDTILTAAEA